MPLYLRISTDFYFSTMGDVSILGRQVKKSATISVEMGPIVLPMPILPSGK